MKNPFKKAPSAVEQPAGQETLQQIQQQFNQVMFELGDLNYRKKLFNEEIAQINDAINTRHQKADQLGKDAVKVRDRIKAEMATKVKEGSKDEKPIEAPADNS